MNNNMNNSATPKQEVIEFLEGLAEGSIPLVGYGVCYNLYKEFCYTFERLPEFFCSGWSEWSGDKTFPVPHPDYEAQYGFYSSREHWKGEYGASRKRFCLYLVEQLKLMSDEDFEKEFCKGATQ